MRACRYGFNGKENDNEVKGIEGSQQDYGMRIYDPRLGRFLSVDPITAQYPELTPYQFASNTPIWAIDLDGLEGVIGGMPTAGATKLSMETGEKISQWISENHSQGVRNYRMADDAQKTAIRQGRPDGDGIAWYHKAYMYLQPLWTDTAPYSDQNDVAVLGTGKNLDGTKATPSDKKYAAVGILLPILGGKLLKEILQGGGKVVENFAKANTFNRLEALTKSAQGKVDEIAETFKAQGKWGDVEAIKVFEQNGNKYVLDGHHRLAAAKKAGIDVKYDIISESELSSYGYASPHQVISASTEVKADKIK